MARLRRLGQIAEVLLRNRLSGQNQEAEQERSFAEAGRVRKAALTDKLSEQAMDPTKYDQLAELAKGFGVQLTVPRPSDLQVMAPMRKEIASATDETALPDENEITTNLQSAFPQRPNLTAPAYGKGNFQDPSSEPDPTALPSSQSGPVRAPAIQQLLAQTEKQKGDIKQKLANLVTQATAMKKGEALGTGQGSEQAAAEAGPAVLGRKTAEFAAMTPLEASRSGAVETATQNARMAPGLVNARVGEAGRTAGAAENAREGAQNSPVNVTGAANRAGAITSAQEGAKLPNLAETTATGHWVRADQANKTATDIEKQGLSFAGASYLPEVMKSQLQKQYNAAVRDFTLSALKTDVGRINKEEYTIYANTYFGQPGDDQATVLAKQQARQAVIDSLRAEGTKGGQQASKLGLKIPIKITPGSALNKLMNQ